jgi:anti-sigma B factor antagonist
MNQKGILSNMEQIISIDSEERGVYFFFRFTGVLSAQTVVDVKHSLEKAISTGTTNIGIDLSGVSHIDSTGLGLLINLSKKMVKEGGHCIFSAPSNAVQLVMKATNTDKVLTIVTTSEMLENRFDSI